ncbi:LPS-assembly protein [Maritalea mobilis]|uniref:LPS-assembly protein LptD n=1 Tax=Maritalea mobilis TaxID=483324 RepID=A0A4R6VTY1_9HYPH|nr:LPS assembly protein LptD [Maritalea mobilis]TDQ63641.1 LPS-assembly protein [Maritalea mobilis]
MSVTRYCTHKGKLKSALLGLGLLATCAFVPAAMAQQTQLLPSNYFAGQALSTTSDLKVTAQTLTVLPAQDLIIATGDVELSAEGYLIRAQRVVYNKRTREVELLGDIAVKDPDGLVYVADKANLTGDFRQGFLENLIFQDEAGYWLSAAEAEIKPNRSLDLNDADITPCGTCVDEKGREIGWRIKAVRIVRDTEEKTIYFERPSMVFAGVPIATIPYLTIPDPSLTDYDELLKARLSYSSELGVGIAYPGFILHDPRTNLTLTPTIFTNQGVLGQLDWSHSTKVTSVKVTGYGIYQFNPSAFAGKLGERNLRGAAQAKAVYTPTEQLTVGGAYTLFSDRSFLTDYDVGDREGSYAVNRVYGTYLEGDSYIDGRIEQYVGLGESGAANEAQQALIAPKVEANHVQQLANDWGEVRLSGKLVHLERDSDHATTVNGTPHVFGFEGAKSHLTLEAGWTNQWVAPGGLLIAPYLGVRGDYAQYNGASGHAQAPAADVVYSATPIAALDVSWPLVGTDSSGTKHYFAPRLQIVSRGGPTNTGITNDDAQSFVFDDTNLFSFNRFSDEDRQDSGTRVAIGGQYNADFGNGRWVDIVVGQSYHIGGTNAAAVANPNQTGIGSGADQSPSYIVAGIQGAPLDGITLGAKTLIDPSNGQVARGSVAGQYSGDIFSAGAFYNYAHRSVAPGATQDRHEVGGNVRFNIDDYWSVGAYSNYDIADQSFVSYGSDLTYDDGYLGGTIYYNRSSANTLDPKDTIGAKLNLKMIGDYAYDYDF